MRKVSDEDQIRIKPQHNIRFLNWFQTSVIAVLLTLKCDYRKVKLSKKLSKCEIYKNWKKCHNSLEKTFNITLNLYDKNILFG